MTAAQYLPGSPFSAENGGEYCTAMVQRHAPTLVAFTNRKGSRTVLRRQPRLRWSSVMGRVGRGQTNSLRAPISG